MATFTAEVFQNEYLPEGATEVNAVVTVTSSGTGGVVASGPASVAEMIIIDSSGSMDMPGTKMVAARRAAQAAIDEIVDGALFAVLAGNTGAQVEYPREPGLVPMDGRVPRPSSGSTRSDRAARRRLAPGSTSHARCS